MTPQERDLIVQLFNRLSQAESQAKDRDAEALIKDGAARVPDAAYLLVQTVLIQDMALAHAEQRIKELEAAPQAEAPPQPSSFLQPAHGSVPNAGPWSRAAAAPAQPPAAPGPVWTNSAAAGGAPPPAPAPPAQTLAMPGASSGFLRSAATTAAGIAGGALLFNGISSLFMPHYGNLFGGMMPQPGLGETVVNNYYGDQQQPPMDTGYNDQTVQADDQDMSQDPGQDSGQDFGDGGGDGGGGTIDI